MIFRSIFCSHHSSRSCRAHLGLISYSIYLIHPLFITFAERSSRHFDSTVTAYALCVLTSFAAIWLLSYLSYRFVELPGRQFVTGLLGAVRIEDKHGSRGRSTANQGRLRPEI